MDMKMQLEARDILSFGRYHARYAPASRKIVLAARLVLPLGAAAAIAVLTAGSGFDLTRTLIAAAISALWILFAPQLVIYAALRTYKKVLRAGKVFKLGAEIGLTVDEKGLVQVNERGRAELPWESIQLLAFSRGYAFAYISKDQAVIVPPRLAAGTGLLASMRGWALAKSVPVDIRRK